MNNKKIGINQIKYSKGKKIYAKGDAAHFAYYVHQRTQRLVLT